MRRVTAKKIFKLAEILTVQVNESLKKKKSSVQVTVKKINHSLKKVWIKLPHNKRDYTTLLKAHTEYLIKRRIK